MSAQRHYQQSLPHLQKSWFQQHRHLPPNSDILAPVGKYHLFRSLRFSSREPLSQVLVITSSSLPTPLKLQGDSCSLQFLPFWYLRGTLSNRNIMWILVFNFLVATLKKFFKMVKLILMMYRVYQSDLLSFQYMITVKLLMRFFIWSFWNLVCLLYLQHISVWRINFTRNIWSILRFHKIYSWKYRFTKSSCSKHRSKFSNNLIEYQFVIFIWK